MQILKMSCRASLFLSIHQLATKRKHLNLSFYPLSCLLASFPTSQSELIFYTSKKPFRLNHNACGVKLHTAGGYYIKSKLLSKTENSSMTREATLCQDAPQTLSRYSLGTPKHLRAHSECWLYTAIQSPDLIKILPRCTDLHPSIHLFTSSS